MEEDSISNEKKDVSFNSQNLALTKAKEKREIFVNVDKKKTLKETAEAFQQRIETAKTRADNPNLETDGVIKSRKPISKKPFVIIIIILILGIAGYYLYPTVKYYIVPSEERGYELLKKDPQKGVEYLYNLYKNKSPEDKSDLLIKVAEFLYESEADEHKDLIKMIVYDAEETYPTFETARSIGEYEYMYGDEEKSEEWIEKANLRPKNN